MTRAGNRTGERHNTRAGGAHRAAGRGREIDTEVSGPEPRARRIERPHDGTCNRTDPPAHRGRARGHRPAEHGEQDDRDDQNKPAIPQRGSLERDEHDSGKARGAPGNLPRTYDTVDGAASATRNYVTIPRSGSGSERRERSWKIALVWIWHTRLSVTPSTLPISASVSPS
jgi:hypothetical protein